MTSQKFYGAFEGMVSLLVNENHSSCFSEMFRFDEDEEQQDPTEEDEDDAIMEFTNITTNAIISFIDNRLRCEHDFHLPESVQGLAPQILFDKLQEYNLTDAFVSTISFHNLLRINADLVISFDNQSFQKFVKMSENFDMTKAGKPA